MTGRTLAVILASPLMLVVLWVLIGVAWGADDPALRLMGGTGTLVLNLSDLTDPGGAVVAVFVVMKGLQAWRPTLRLEVRHTHGDRTE